MIEVPEMTTCKDDTCHFCDEPVVCLCDSCDRPLCDGHSTGDSDKWRGCTTWWGCDGD